MLVATLASAGTKRVEIIRGFATITLDGADSTGFVNAFRPVQISEMTSSSIEWQDRSWDRMVGSVIMPNFTDAGDSVPNENEVDTLRANYTFISSWYTFQAESDTVTLPGTTFFVIDKNLWADPTESIYGSDSSSTTIKPNLTGDFQSLLMDQFVLEYYITDTAGASGVLTGTLQWFFKFYEDD